MSGKLVLNKELAFTDVLDHVNNFVNGSISEKDFKEWIESLNIRASIPIMQKADILMNIVSEFFYSSYDSQELIICELYRNLFFYLYLSGYLGVQNIEVDDASFENYDILEPVLGPIIEEYAGRDIHIFKSMLKDSLSSYSNIAVQESLSAINIDSIEQIASDNKKMIDSLKNNGELFKNLKEIVANTNPAVQSLNELINSSALSETK